MHLVEVPLDHVVVHVERVGDLEEMAAGVVGDVLQDVVRVLVAQDGLGDGALSDLEAAFDEVVDLLAADNAAADEVRLLQLPQVPGGVAWLQVQFPGDLPEV